MPSDNLPEKDWLPFSEHLKKLGSPAQQEAPPLAPPGTLFNRNLSWLHFNDRVLSEAAASSVPLLERLRFATIVSSNLDEFFMVRVAEMARTARRAPREKLPDGYTVSQTLSQIRDHVLRQKAEQAAVLKNILAGLNKEGLAILAEFAPDPALDQEIRERLPEMRIIVRRMTDPLPQLASDRIHLFVRFPGRYAIISIVDRGARLIPLDPAGRVARFAVVDRWLQARAASFFPGQEVIEAFPFKIIRDAGIRYHPDDDDEPLEAQIIQAIESRSKAKVIRLEVDAPHYSEGALFLATGLGLDSGALYRFDLPLDLRALAKVYNIPGFDRLRYPPVKPQTLSKLFGNRPIFNVIRERDILLHHPYDSFDIIIKFLQAAAADPHVTEISHTLYRTSRESPVMEALKQARINGKKVTVYVEIKARFDELNNVRWATELRKAGVKVARPFPGSKVHCKLTRVVRTENGESVTYLHLGTGNYHPGTALQYTDLGLLTADAQLGREAGAFFTAISKRQESAQDFSEILAAPMNLHDQFIRLIEEETRLHQGGGKGHIIAKMNSLVDPDIIRALYKASQAGVKIELIVRGICCLRPGVKGLSETIRVTSIVDRFLEHSRIYYFRSGGAKRLYLGSADWMPRNFYSRYELVFPVKDPALKKFIRGTVLEAALQDNTKAWVLKPDGAYERLSPSSPSKAVRSQFLLEQLARNSYPDTPLRNRTGK